MAAPKSPRSPKLGGQVKVGEKEETFWEKIGTLGRKKKIKEVQEIQEEGKIAIDSPGNPNQPDIPPEDYSLREREQRAVIDPQSYMDPQFRKLQQILVDWVNDELADQRIIVQKIEEDLYDGQVLHKLWEKLSGKKLDVLEVTQSEEGQRQKLHIVLSAVNHTLGFHHKTPKWTVESVHSKNIVAILHLLVALVRYFRAPVRLPENIFVTVIIAEKNEGVLNAQKFQEQITSEYDDVGMRCEKDAFDTLFDCAPEKLTVVKKSLVTFVNKHLAKLNFEVQDLNQDFRDGVYMCLLMGLLGGFFVPLYEFHLTPKDEDQMIHNVAFSFELMQDVGLPKPKARPEDIVNMDLKSTLRLHVGVEAIRTAELLFQPSMIGNGETGLAELIEYIFKFFTPEEQLLLAKNVFLTGGCSQFPGLKERLSKELLEMRPFQTPHRIHMAESAVLDAWYGSKNFSCSEDFGNYLITREEYNEKGGEYLREHSCSNFFFPTPPPIPVAEQPQLPQQENSNS